MVNIIHMPITERYPYSETAEVQDSYGHKISRLSPSVKLVFKILEYKGLMTQKELVAESYLPPRTVRYALDKLKKEGVLEERLFYKDARQSLYALKSSLHDEIISNFACGIV